MSGCECLYTTRWWLVATRCHHRHSINADSDDDKPLCTHAQIPATEQGTSLAPGSNLYTGPQNSCCPSDHHHHYYFLLTYQKMAGPSLTQVSKKMSKITLPLLIRDDADEHMAEKNDNPS